MKKKKKTGLKIILTIIAIILVLTGAFLIYVSDYYHAEEIALGVANIADNVEISTSNDTLVFDPGNADTALIFYPGGKVEFTAYEPLMIKLAQKGILCILPKMPFNLAVFDVNAADTYISSHSEITHWYVGGHSLGGSMAASFASKNSVKVEGLILLASYSTSDLSSSSLKVLSIYGSNDGVLNRENYENDKSNLPQGFIEVVLDGGNHAGFGCYGSQNGDGEASIDKEKQQSETVDTIVEFIFAK